MATIIIRKHGVEVERIDMLPPSSPYAIGWTSNNFLQLTQTPASDLTLHAWLEMESEGLLFITAVQETFVQSIVNSVSKTLPPGARCILSNNSLLCFDEYEILLEIPQATIEKTQFLETSKFKRNNVESRLQPHDRASLASTPETLAISATSSPELEDLALDHPQQDAPGDDEENDDSTRQVLHAGDSVAEDMPASPDTGPDMLAAAPLEDTLVDGRPQMSDTRNDERMATAVSWRVAVSYSPRMYTWHTYPLHIDWHPLGGQQPDSAKSADHGDRPKWNILPIFPGTLVTPPVAVVDACWLQQVQFTLMPQSKSRSLDAYVEVQQDGRTIARIATPVTQARWPARASKLLAHTVNAELSPAPFPTRQVRAPTSVAASKPQADTCYQRAREFARRGLPDQAAAAYDQALAIYRQLDAGYDYGLMLCNVASFYLTQKNHDRALALYAEEQAVWIRLGKEPERGRCLSNIGILYQTRQQYDKSIVFLKEAIEVRRSAGDRRGQICSMQELTRCYCANRNFSECLDMCEQLHVILNEYDKKEQAFVYHMKGAIAYEAFEYDDAIEYFQDALSLNELMALPLAMANDMFNLGLCYRAKQNKDMALEYLQRAYTIYSKYGLTGENRHWLQLAEQYLRQLEQWEV